MNRAKRLRWATRIQNWTVDGHWGGIMFSDESRFNLSFNDGRVRCWRSPGELNDPATFNAVVRSVVYVMFWGCISIYGIGQLAIVDCNMDQFKYINILDEKSLALCRKYVW